MEDLILVMETQSTPSITSTRRRWRGPRPLAITLIMAMVPLICSGCVPPRNAVSPVATGASSALMAALAPEGGNPTGSGSARLRLTPEQQEICFVLTVTGIELPATAAHVHRGASGVNGSVVVSLVPPSTSGGSAGCTSAPVSVINAILQHPADYYLNVHNARFPDGALRGQLAPCGSRAGC